MLQLSICLSLNTVREAWPNSPDATLPEPIYTPERHCESELFCQRIQHSDPAMSLFKPGPLYPSLVHSLVRYFVSHDSFASLKIKSNNSLVTSQLGFDANYTCDHTNVARQMRHVESENVVHVGYTWKWTNVIPHFLCPGSATSLSHATKSVPCRSDLKYMIKYLSRDLSESGPRRFASEKSLPQTLSIYGS